MEPVDRVRKLRALAARTTFPAEAESCRTKADALMAKHGLSEAQVAPVPEQPRVPIVQHGWTRITINGIPMNMPMPMGFPVQGNGTSAQPGFVSFTMRFG
jgi:hypothetical protein